MSSQKNDNGEIPFSVQMFLRLKNLKREIQKAITRALLTISHI